MSAEPSLFFEPRAEPEHAVARESASLYRAYRSLTFGELVGQHHVTQTLLNAVRYGKVAHAYLFTGPRGTGKTSAARILARAVNCLQPRDGEPCNICAVCVSMLERRSLDVVEIDGASNNSVDDVRELRERVNFRPAEARKKVFIIDEVHMLSIGAFNALLKTLEEPPEHVLFALATTEVHKVPATVLSRCQQLDLRPIARPEMVSRLRYVCQQERIQTDDDVLGFIATQSTGSLRDALSLLEQIRAYCGDVLHLDEVEASLGVARLAQIATLADLMAAGDLPMALLTIGELADGGIDPRQIARQLAGYWRDALLARARRQPVHEPHVARCTSEQIVPVLRSLLGMESAGRRSDSPRWALELAIAEAVLQIGGTQGPAQRLDRPPEPPAAKQNPSLTSTDADRQIAPKQRSADAAWPSIAPAALEPSSAAPDREESRAPATPYEATRSETDNSTDAREQRGTEAAPEQSEPAPLSNLAQHDERPVQPVRASNVEENPATTEHVRERWPEVMRWLNENRKQRVHANLGYVTPGAISVDNGAVTIGFAANGKGFVRGQLELPASRQVIEQAMSAVFGGRWGVRYVTIEGLAPAAAMETSDMDYLESIAAEDARRARERGRSG